MSEPATIEVQVRAEAPAGDTEPVCFMSARAVTTHGQTGMSPERGGVGERHLGRHRVLGIIQEE